MLLLSNMTTSWVETQLSCFPHLQSVLRFPVSSSRRMLVVALAGAQAVQLVSMIRSSCWPGHLATEKDVREQQRPLMPHIVIRWLLTLTCSGGIILIDGALVTSGREGAAEQEVT